MERRCCLLNIIGAHSLDSILLPSDLRLRLFCLILRPICRPMPALAFACYAAVLLYIPYWETLKQATRISTSIPQWNQTHFEGPLERQICKPMISRDMFTFSFWNLYMYLYLYLETILWHRQSMESEIWLHIYVMDFEGKHAAVFASK